MNNFDIHRAQSLKILIEFDAEALKDFPDLCLRYQFCDGQNNQLHFGNDLDGIKDEELIAIIVSLMNITKIVDSEINPTTSFKNDTVGV